MRITVIMIVLSLGVLMGVHAHAQDKNPCKTDIAKHCHDIKPGEGRLYKCLKIFDKDLTPSCKKRIAQIEEAVQEVSSACADDYNLYCSSVLPGQGRVADCLKRAEKQLSRKCKSALAETKKKAEEVKKEMKGE
ncbi:MAG: cysteine rich repeat-containing protein [Nitrospirota bacterium]